MGVFWCIEGCFFVGNVLFGIRFVFYKIYICTIVCHKNDKKVQKIPKIVVLTLFLTITPIFLIICVLNIVVKMLKNIVCVLKERC